jgi:hypothetical protein
MGARMLESMRTRAERDGELPLGFTDAPGQQPTGRVSLATDRTGQPTYMDLHSSDSPLHEVAEECREATLTEIERPMREAVLAGRDGCQGPEADAIQAGPLGVLTRTVAETDGGVRDAIRQPVEVPEGLSEEDQALAVDRGHNLAGQRALDEAAQRQGVAPDELRAKLVEMEVKSQGGIGGAASEAAQNEYRNYLTTKVAPQPERSLYRQVFLERGGEALASIKVDRAMAAARREMGDGIIHGVPESDERVQKATFAAATRLEPRTVDNQPATSEANNILAEQLRHGGGGQFGQIDPERDGFADLNQGALSKVTDRLAKKTENPDAAFGPIGARLNGLVSAKVNTPDPGRRWEALGDYLMTGGQGSVADDATAKLMIRKAAAAEVAERS